MLPRFVGVLNEIVTHNLSCSNASKQLINPGGWVDRSLLMGRAGMFNIIKRNYARWNIHTDGNIEKSFAERGVLDKKTLPVYPYRDDSLLVWHAICEYVNEYVKGVYSKGEHQLFLSKLYYNNN